MNAEMTNHDQADGTEILTYTVSDEALEDAAGKEDNKGVGPATSANLGSSWVGCCCGG